MSGLDSTLIGGFLLGVVLIAAGSYFAFGLWSFLMILGVVSLFISFGAHRAKQMRKQVEMDGFPPDE